MAGQEGPKLTYFCGHNESALTYKELRADSTASAQQIIEVPHKDG